MASGDLRHQTQFSDNATRDDWYLLELGGGECVLDLISALRQTFPTGEEGQEPLLHLSVGQDGGHHLRRADTGQVHCRAAGDVRQPRLIKHSSVPRLPLRRLPTCRSLSSRRRWDVHGGEDALKVAELDGLVGAGAAH